MAIQSGKGMIVVYKAETTFNTVPGVASGARRLRFNGPSPGLNLSRADIQSNESRGDRLTPLGRKGSRSVGGQYGIDVSIGELDILLPAIMQVAYVAAVTFGQAELTSLEVTDSSTLVAGGGSFITEGVRVGDVIRLTGMDDPLNNDINLRVKTVSASTIVTHGALLTVDAADVTFTMTILKKATNPAAGSLVRSSYWIEQYGDIIDVSAQFGGNRVNTLAFRGGPDSMATCEVGFVGASVTPLVAGSSPFYTTPTLGGTDPLTFVDANLSLGGVDLGVATGFELNLNANCETLPVIAANDTPDVFEGDLQISGSLQVARETLAYVSAQDAETEYEVHLMLQESNASAAPRGAFSIFLPRILLGDVTAPMGSTGALIETLPFTAGLKVAATGYDGTMLSHCTET